MLALLLCRYRALWKRSMETSALPAHKHQQDMFRKYRKITFLDCPLLRRICLLWCLIQTCIQETCQENDSAADHWHAFYKPRRVEAEIVRGEGFDSNQFKSHMQFHHVSSLVLWRSRGKWKPLHTFASLLDRGCSWHLPCKKSPPKLCLTAGKSAKLQMDANGKNIC